MMAAQIDFDFEGWDELTAQFRQAGTRGRVIFNDGLRSIGRLIVPNKGSGPMADATPKRSGKLARSTIFQIVGGPENQVLEIRQGAMTEEGEFYGHFVRGGTKPHTIRPKKAKVLHFEVGGDEVFTQEVRHPGTKANPYHERVLRALRPRIDGVIRQMGERLTSFLAGR